MADPDYCPEHGSPDDALQAWSCPVAVEGDPPEAQTCHHFAAELIRRIEDVEAGNFYRMSKDENGERWVQQYRNHQPVGDPEPL